MNKKFLITPICGIIVLSGCTFFKSAQADIEDIFAKTYLKDVTVTNPLDYGVYNPLDKYNIGFSIFSAGLDKITNQEDNKYLRLSNFNSTNKEKYSETSFYIDALPITNKVKISFDYRFKEGKISYASEENVLNISFRNESISIPYIDLETKSYKDFSWSHLEIDLNIASTTITSSRLDVDYFFKNSLKSSNPTNYIDLDNFSLKSNGIEYFKNSKFNNLNVTTNDLKVCDMNLSKDGRDQYLNYLLDNSEIKYFDQNTTIEETILNESLTYYDYYKELKYPSLKYTNASQPVYEVYSQKEDNYFLHIQNTEDGIKDVVIQNYFYNNELKKQENIKSTNMFKYSFDYRIYMDEAIQTEYLKDSNPLLFLSSRLVSYNNGGYLNLDNFIINEPGDLSWHTYSGYLNVAITSSTNYIQITYFNKSSREDNTIINFDNFYISSYDENENRFYNDGSFEFNKDNNYHPITSVIGNNKLIPNIFNRSSYGNSPTSATNGMILENNSSLSLDSSSLDIGAYKLEIYSKTNINNLCIMLGGTSGIIYSTSILESYFKYDNLTNKFVCYFASDAIFDSLDLINKGEDFFLNRITLYKIANVCILPGNYDEFSNRINELLDNIDFEKLTHKSKLEYDLFISSLSNIDEYSSQELMTNKINELLELKENLNYKSNLDRLNEQINKSLLVYSTIEKTAQNAYEYIVFEETLYNALNATENIDQDEINNLELALKTATENLLEASK